MRIGSLIDVRREIYASNHRKIVYWITHREQLFSDLLQQGVRLSARCHNALALASMHVQIQPVEAKSIRAGLAPVHVGQRLIVVRIRITLQGDVAIIQQPRIQVERAPVWSEPVIRQNQQSCVLIQLGKNLAEHLVHLLVELLENGTILRGQGCVVCRMLGVNQPPQHVRVEVETGEIKEEDTFLKFGKLQIKNAAMLGQHSSGLLEKFLVIQHAVGESLGVLCNSLRVELSYFL